MDFDEFHGRVCDVLIEVQKACDENPAVREQVLPDLRELLAIVRGVASELILCSSVQEAIDRLKQDQLKLGAVEYVASFGLTEIEIKAAIRNAYEKHTADTPDFPCLAFCSYLDELCNELKPGKGPHKE
jgi:hypothetical protein